MHSMRWLWVSSWGWLLLTSLLVQQPVLAKEREGEQSNPPKIGLALSGGGARGAAHVGVLKVLEQLRIPVHYIAGTSMGSIIGGLYASGMTPEEIEKALESMDWEHIFSDDPPREDRSFHRKRDDDLYLVQAKPGISDEGKLKFPTGAIQGQKFNLALTQLTLSVSGVADFDRLSIPFRAVASNIGSGESVVLSKGDLATAMRASMSVPGAFAATRIDGQLLVDGGITNNLPIDVVRQMGADIVIAIDISSPYMAPENVDNLFSITSQLTSIMTRTNADRQIATLTDRDILVVPELGDITSSDFSRSAEAISRGYKAAKEKQDQLKRLAVPGGAYREYLAMRSDHSPLAAPIVHFVRIDNDSTVSDGMIRDRLNQPVGAPLDREQLEHDIGNIYGLELFQSVDYRIVEENGKSGLLVKARARNWGPNYLQGGLKLSSDGQGVNSYNLGAAYLRTGINSLGGEIRVGLQVGEEPGIVGEWYQPLDTLSRYFVHTKFGFGSYQVGLYSQNTDNLADFRVSETALDLAIGREFSVYGEGRLGYRYRTGDVELQTGSPGWPEFDYDTTQIYARLSVDRLDNFNFPEKGWLGNLEYATAREALGSDSNFDQVSASVNKFTTFGDGHVLGFGMHTELTTKGEAEIQNRYRIGGFLKLSGYPENSLSGQQAGVVAGTYYRRFKPLPFLSLYAGGSLEYGGVWEEQSDFGRDGIAAGSLFLGADTPIGPAYLGLGVAEGGQNAAFFYLGRPLFQ